MERVQLDSDEADWASVLNCDEDVTLIIGATRSDRVSLTLPPVGMKAKKDLIAENIAHRREDRSPRTEGELNDRLKIFLAELADLDRVLGHGAAQRYSSDQVRRSPDRERRTVGRQQSKGIALLGSDMFPDVSIALTTISVAPVTSRQYAIVPPEPMAPSSSWWKLPKNTS